MENVGRLKLLLAKAERDAWRDSLQSVLADAETKEIPGNPQMYRVSFILDRARMRLSSSINLRLETFGVSELISVLEQLSPADRLEGYSLKNCRYTGTCFVWRDQLIGCEFVARRLARTIPYRG